MLNNKALAASLSAGPKTYIEDVFSSWLYAGNGSTQTITNGIDLSGKGGLVWTKRRDTTASHFLIDTSRGANISLSSNTASPQDQSTSIGWQFSSNGYSQNNGFQELNNSSGTYVSWTFRKAPKFFDVVTYTGNGVAGRTVSHNLGSTPGCVIVKCTSSATNWALWHRGASNAWFRLNTTANEDIGNAPFVFGNDSVVIQPTSTNFTVASDIITNGSGATYVAYLFAHDAGGFGDSGNDNVISCGSFTTDASGAATVTLGWEPQWVLFKRSNASAGGSQDRWQIIDNLRGLGTAGTTQQVLFPNTSDAESAWPVAGITSTGFATTNAGYVAGNSTFIYIAIRRGPMKTPTDATKVFSANASSGSEGTVITTGFPVDLQLFRVRTAVDNSILVDRLRGVSTVNTSQATAILQTSNANAETALFTVTRDWSNTGFDVSANFSGFSSIYCNFRRAPGFFDVVAYTGTGANRTVSHNLGVVPEFIVAKRRNTTGPWAVYAASLGVGSIFVSTGLRLNAADGASFSNTIRFYQTPTATDFFIGTDSDVNTNTGTYIAYLFATCPGISKVGSYTGTGTTLNIDCGFTNGARFVLIKRTDSTGDWYVWDTARGIISANDPYLLLNSTAAEVTNTDYIDPLSPGFQISSTAPAAINANGGSFIFLAIA